MYQVFFGFSFRGFLKGWLLSEPCKPGALDGHVYLSSKVVTTIAGLQRSRARFW